MSGGGLAWLYSVAVPAVQHSQVVKHRQVPLAQLVLHAAVLVADGVEQFQSFVNLFCRVSAGEGLRAPHLIVEVDLLDLLLPVQLECGSTEPLVEGPGQRSRVLVCTSCIPEVHQSCAGGL